VPQTYTQLTRDQRCQIEALLKSGHTQKYAAEFVGVHPATISRERRRNSHSDGYEAASAQEKATLIRSYASRRPIAMTEDVRKKVFDYLKTSGASPEQISGRLALEGVKISHVSIYDYIKKNHTEENNYFQYLRRKGVPYRYGNENKNGSKIIERVGIENRPKFVDAKERLGDLEFDTIIGVKHKSAILTVVDRASKYTWARSLDGKTAEFVFQATLGIFVLINSWFRVLTMTFDNGLEFAYHYKIRNSLNELNGLNKEDPAACKTYFARLYKSCDRGLNEHTNGLLREYFPKGTDFAKVSQKQLDEAVEKINNRPRKVLGYLTPKEFLHNALKNK
jgi:transposase, IS30 family